MKTSQLVWSPIFESLEAQGRRGDPLLLLISPFITVNALKRFLGSVRVPSGLQVVARWRSEDVRGGVCDIEVYPYLAERGIPLYINPEIHLKLYVFQSNTAFSTSGNLTARGFGYIAEGNIEVGTYVDLTRADWTRIYELISSSRQVDDEVYRRYLEYVESLSSSSLPESPPPLIGGPKMFTISALPAVSTPERLAELYFDLDQVEVSAEEIRRAAHDCAVFGIRDGLGRAEFETQIATAFRESAFVVAFLDVLRETGSLRFGAVNDWLHQKCEDVPLPYRWEIKTNTRILYDWLQHFYPEITWDRPHHSQVIYWQDDS